MRLAELAAAATAVGASRSRSAKTEILADLLRRLAPSEAEAATGLLLGKVRQGRIGVGWRTLYAVAQEARTPDAAVPREDSGTPLEVLDVDAALDRIAAVTGAGSVRARHTELGALFARADDAERELLLHALGGEVRTGALDGVLTDALARAIDRPLAQVRRAVMLSGSLGAMVRAGLEDPDSLAAVGLSVGTAVQPMLASTAASVPDALAVTGLASVEHKLDGARIQVHRNGSAVSVFTRSLADITDRVPEIVEVARSLPADRFILDGETLALDESGAPRPFQDTMARFGAEAAREQVLAPRFFDVLHLDGQDLLDRPLAERLPILERLVGEHRIAGQVTDDPDVAQGVLEAALAAGHEGVLVKGADTAYTAGRRGKSWLKVKPVHTYDLVVLGVEWGSGRRRGWLSNLHLGARDATGEFGPLGGFVMVGKTFKGLTDELLRWQTQELPRHEVERSRWGLRLRPEVVVEIAIDGVQRSSRYPGGVALRFARVKGYRPDKGAAEADTIQALRALLPGGPPTD
jgi:DNA ligase-1